VFVQNRLVQPGLMLVGKTRSLSNSGTPDPSMQHLKGVLLGQTQLTPTNIRLGWKGLPKTKHSSLLRKSVNYGRKNYYNIGPWWQNLAADLSWLLISVLTFLNAKVSLKKGLRVFRWTLVSNFLFLSGIK
jgi:hypothetical protein